MRRVGVLELLVDAVEGDAIDRLYGATVKKQYASIMPQAVACWCRQLGHDVTYATYYGQCDPLRLLPEDLDIVFFSCYTQSSALACALAKIFRARRALTVLGGPHARSFPADALRFFDLVVLDCDRELVAEIVRGVYDPGSIVRSARPLADVPSVEERLPEILASAFTRGRRRMNTTVPLRSSVGCPYTCDFCVDWRTAYLLLPLERLARDLEFLARRSPRVMVAYHDPNFGVKFDRVLSVIEAIPAERPNPYIIESSLSLLRTENLERLKRTRCIYVASGVESWEDYSRKAGVGTAVGRRKLERVVAHFRQIREYVVGLQANFVFGTDADAGDEPVELTKEFMRALPFVWPVVNIPTPFGGTPLFDRYRREGRILERMPFGFYYTPYLVIVPLHYDPLAYFDKLIELWELMVSPGLLWRRFEAPSTWGLRILHVLRTLVMRKHLALFRKIRRLLVEDPRFREFHEGRDGAVPEFYHHELDLRLGRYASLLSRAERTPDLGQDAPVAGARALGTGGSRHVAAAGAGG